MSSTRHPVRAGERDAYYTPDAFARVAVATLGGLHGVRCWEPHAGGGAFVRALVEAGADTHWSDADPDAPVYQRDRPDLVRVSCGHEACDALHGWPFTMRERPAWVIGNPPFNEAQAHVEMALRTATVGVAFLLRLAFLEGAKRRAFWSQHRPAEVHVLSERPSFTGGSTDSAAYGWFVWRQEVPHEPILRWLSWRGGDRG